MMASLSLRPKTAMGRPSSANAWICRCMGLLKERLMLKDMDIDHLPGLIGDPRLVPQHLKDAKSSDSWQGFIEPTQAETTTETPEKTSTTLKKSGRSLRI